MKYLILRSFTSYGNRLKKGTVVDEADIRNVKIRRSEKKIYPVVSSSPVEQPAQIDVAKAAEQKPEEPKIKLSLNMNKNLSLG